LARAIPCQLLCNLRRRFLLRSLGFAPSLLRPQPDGGQLPLSGRDLRSELRCRRFRTRGQRRLKVDCRGRGLGTCPLVEGFGLLSSGHCRALGVLSGHDLAVGVLQQIFRLLPGGFREVFCLLSCVSSSAAPRVCAAYSSAS